MKQPSDTRTIETDLTWLKDDDPEIYHLLRALDGDLDALRWLKNRGDGLFLFVEALTGAKEAVDMLQARPDDKLGDLFDMISHCDVEEWLSENHPQLQGLFAYVRGDDEALKGNKKASFKRVAEIIRDKYQNYRDDEADGLASSDGLAAAPEGVAADVGCLIGEMHLHNQDFHKAIEAFSRAISIDPTPDAYSGRARAHRALAALDDHAAAELREKT